MIDLSSIVKHAKKAASDNTPVILTAIGVSGTVVTALLTGRACFKAAELLADAQRPMDIACEGDVLETREKFDLTWKLYVPAVGTGAITVACIIGSNRISTSRSAALAAAYALAQDGFKEYKDKVLEKLGEKKETEIRDSVAQDQIDRHSPWPAELIIIGDAEMRCFDAFSGRYFKGNVQNIKDVEIAINQQIINDGYASLSDFYHQLGLRETTISDEVGWTTDGLLHINFSAVLSEKMEPCISITFQTNPIRNFSMFN